MKKDTDFKAFIASQDERITKDVNTDSHDDFESIRSTSRGSKGSGDTSSWYSAPSSPKPATQYFVVTPDNSEKSYQAQNENCGPLRRSKGSGDLLGCLTAHTYNVVTPDSSAKTGKSAPSSKTGHMELVDVPEVVDRTDEALPLPSSREDPQCSSPSATVPKKNPTLEQSWLWLWKLLVFSYQVWVLLFTEISAPQDVVMEHNCSPLHRMEAQPVIENQDQQSQKMALFKAEEFVLKGSLMIVVLTELAGNFYRYGECLTNNDSLNDWLWASIGVRIICCAVVVSPCCFKSPERYGYLQHACFGMIPRFAMNAALLIVESVLFWIVGSNAIYVLIVVLLLLDCGAVFRCLVVRCFKIEHYVARLGTSCLLHLCKLVVAFVIVSDFYRNERATSAIPGLCYGAMIVIFLLKVFVPKADKFKLLLSQLSIASIQGLVYSCGYAVLCGLRRK